MNSHGGFCTENPWQFTVYLHKTPSTCSGTDLCRIQGMQQRALNLQYIACRPRFLPLPGSRATDPNSALVFGYLGPPGTYACFWPWARFLTTFWLAPQACYTLTTFMTLGCYPASSVLLPPIYDNSGDSNLGIFLQQSQNLLVGSLGWRPGDPQLRTVCDYNCTLRVQ